MKTWFFLTLTCLTLLGCGHSAEERKAEYEVKLQAAKVRLREQQEIAKAKARELKEPQPGMAKGEHSKAILEAFDIEKKPLMEYAQEVERLQIEYGLRKPK